MSQFTPDAFTHFQSASEIEDDLAMQVPSVTLLTSEGLPLAKSISIKQGLLCKTSLSTLSHGIAEIRSVATAEALNHLLEGLTRNQAISIGVLKKAASARIGRKGRLKGREISRTKDHFCFPVGRAWLLWDYDAKSMPPEVARRVEELGGPLKAFYHICPEARSAAQVVRPSSSDGLYAPRIPLERSDGRHGYFLFREGTRIPEALRVLQERAWAAGLAWFAVSASGALLERSIVDITVGSPERIIFEAAPILVAPVKRKPNPTFVREGEAMAVPTLTEETRIQAKALKTAARQAVKPTAKATKQRFVEARTDDHVRCLGVSRMAAGRAVKALLKDRILEDDSLLELADGRRVRAGDLLDGKAGHPHRSMPDPVEGIGYGRDKATLFLEPRPGHPDDDPCIVSHAHGEKMVYRFARFENAAMAPAYPMPPTGDERAPAIAAMRERIAEWGRLSDQFARAHFISQVEASGTVHCGALAPCQERDATQAAMAGRDEVQQ
ncbi:MAG: hypothetical protein ACU0BO_11075 [Limimaricola soesokkakensis]|uniref:hypothetical protein n=1 Tax=Limimaricola soesokkakensis TaxID=1343159 RepID=UPI004059568E